MTTPLTSTAQSFDARAHMYSYELYNNNTRDAL